MSNEGRMRLPSTYVHHLETEVLQVGLEEGEIGRNIVRRVGLAADGMFSVGKSRHTGYQDILRETTKSS